jgi:rod shape-determining protein MreD
VRALAFVGAGLLLATVQAVLLRRVGGGTLPLQLVVPCIAWLALEAENVEGLVAAAGTGWVLDAFAGTPTGLFTFLGVLAFLLCRGAGMAVDLRSRAGFAVLSGAACLGMAIGAVLLQRWAGVQEAAPGAGLLPRMLGEAVLTALASPLVLLGMNRLDGLLGREEPGLVP